MTSAPRLLAEHTTFRVGGPAADWIVAADEDTVVAAVRACDDAGIPVLVLGGGSNLLVSDSGFPGTVVEVATSGIEAREEDDRVVVTLAAGEPWDDFVSRAVARGWADVEALSGIPGRVGATPVQNVGAYGQDVAQVLIGVRVLDREAGRVVDLPAEECGFGYRDSRFKRESGRWVVLSVTLSLRVGGTGQVRYAELADFLGVPVGADATVGSIRGGVLALRARKGMVVDPADPDTWGAGSFFTNPIVDPDTAARVDASCPRYPASHGVKLSAAWLIEQSGMGRGFRLGPNAQAAISSKHTLALTNRGGASAADVVDLARAVRSRVEATFGLVLEPEPTLVGLSL